MSRIVSGYHYFRGIGCLQIARSYNGHVVWRGGKAQGNVVHPCLGSHHVASVLNQVLGITSKVDVPVIVHTEFVFGPGRECQILCFPTVKLCVVGHGCIFRISPAAEAAYYTHSFNKGGRGTHGGQIYLQIVIPRGVNCQVSGTRIGIQNFKGSAVIGVVPVGGTGKLEDIGKIYKSFVMSFRVTVQYGSCCGIPPLVSSRDIQFFREACVDISNGIGIHTYIQNYFVFSCRLVKDQVCTGSKAYIVDGFSAG